MVVKVCEWFIDHHAENLKSHILHHKTRNENVDLIKIIKKKKKKSENVDLVSLNHNL